MKKIIASLVLFCICTLSHAYTEYMTNADGGRIELHKHIKCNDPLINKATPKGKTAFEAYSRLKNGELILRGCAIIDEPYIRIIWIDFGYDTFTYATAEVRSVDPNDPRHAQSLPLVLPPKVDFYAPRRWMPPALPQMEDTNVRHH